MSISNNPYLIQMIKDNKVGYEVCPISNYILGYTLDMRWHPIRTLMASGVEVTLSSDDPTFWDYEGLTLDFTYAFIAWQLDLKDLKQLGINSIKQSTLRDRQKKAQLEKFHQDWDKFIKDFLKSHFSTS